MKFYRRIFSLKFHHEGCSAYLSLLSEESAVLVGYKNVNFEGYGIFSWNLYRAFGVTINEWNFFDEPFPNRIIHSYT